MLLGYIYIYLVFIHDFWFIIPVALNYFLTDRNSKVKVFGLLFFLKHLQNRFGTVKVKTATCYNNVGPLQISETGLGKQNLFPCISCCSIFFQRQVIETGIISNTVPLCLSVLELAIKKLPNHKTLIKNNENLK